ncbi:MAG: hypothetical protein VW362_08510 [Candidatus Nanopelagicales bacterium]|jgi:hypothetical protein
MAGMGPPPKHPDQKRRRNARPALTQLPAEGRKGRAPKWPLALPPNAVEEALWASLWRTPQAVLWERTHATREVAMYAVWSAKAEAGDLDAGKESRMLADRLGLTPLALRRLECEVAPADEKPQQRSGSNVRRLRAVDPVAS